MGNNTSINVPEHIVRERIIQEDIQNILSDSFKEPIDEHIREIEIVNDKRPMLSDLSKRMLLDALEEVKTHNKRPILSDLSKKMLLDAMAEVKTHDKRPILSELSMRMLSDALEEAETYNQKQILLEQNEINGDMQHTYTSKYMITSVIDSLRMNIQEISLENDMLTASLETYKKLYHDLEKQKSHKLQMSMNFPSKSILTDITSV